MFDFTISISLFLLFELFKFVVFEKGFQKPNSPHSWVNLFQTKYIIILNVMCFQIWYIISKCHKINYTFKKKKLEYIYYFLFIFFRVFLIWSWVLINFRPIDILFQNIHQYILDISQYIHKIKLPIYLSKPIFSFLFITVFWENCHKFDMWIFVWNNIFS